jgi:predicted dithiol-disulfide oxidoreductase (DUF899 family)
MAGSTRSSGWVQQWLEVVDFLIWEIPHTFEGGSNQKEGPRNQLHDQLAVERRALPWVKIEKEYVFDAPAGKVTLADLFDGRSQLFIKHFMMGPGQVAQCVGCSLEVDHIEGVLEHLQNHDVTYTVVARAPIEEIEVVRKHRCQRENSCQTKPG